MWGKTPAFSEQGSGKINVTLPLLALFIATFCIATTELAVVGLISDIARDLAVSIPKAGLLVSGYALGVAVGGPVFTIATASLSRKVALLLMMGVFVAGHALAAVAPNYPVLMTARVVAATCHASFLGIAAVVAAASVPAGRSARAVSMVWLGFSAASLLGVPAGAALGHALGWRSTFWALTVLGCFSLLAIALWVPETGRPGAGSLGQEFKALRRRQVLLAMVMSLLVCAATFAVFTYVGPLLESEAGIPEASLPAILLLFGIGGTIGLIVGGRIGDGKALQSVVGMFVALAILYGALAVFIGNVVLVWAAMIAWGFLFLAPRVPLQARVVREAKEGPNLASTLNQSAFNVGNALGSSLGAAALSFGFGYQWLPLLGAMMALAGAGVGIVAMADRK
jgi:MFS transporter, DHA1 family, inner membrane transport protein